MEQNRKTVKIKNYYLTVAEVAESLSISEQSVFKLLRRGEMKGYKFGGQWRVHVDDLGKFVHEAANK